MINIQSLIVAKMLLDYDYRDQRLGKPFNDTARRSYELDRINNQPKNFKVPLMRNQIDPNASPYEPMYKHGQHEDNHSSNVLGKVVRNVAHSFTHR